MNGTFTFSDVSFPSSRSRNPPSGSYYQLIREPGRTLRPTCMFGHEWRRWKKGPFTRVKILSLADARDRKLHRRRCFRMLHSLRSCEYDDTRVANESALRDVDTGFFYRGWDGFVSGWGITFIDYWVPFCWWRFILQCIFFLGSTFLPSIREARRSWMAVRPV